MSGDDWWDRMTGYDPNKPTQTVRAWIAQRRKDMYAAPDTLDELEAILDKTDAKAQEEIMTNRTARLCIVCREPAVPHTAFCGEACRDAYRNERSALTAWTRDDALPFLAQLAPVLREAGWGLALGGSVLTDGYSKKDLDLIVFPLSAPSRNFERLEAALLSLGLRRMLTAAEVQALWAKKGSNDTKLVEVWRRGHRRIDVFMLA